MMQASNIFQRLLNPFLGLLRAAQDPKQMYTWLRGVLFLMWLLIWWLPVCSTSDDPAWSPNGKQIAFTCSNSIYVTNISGTQWKKISGFTGHTSGQPAWSPDGQKIAFNASDDIYIVNKNGGGQINLTEDFLRDVGEFAWSPDGHKIAFDTLTGFSDDVLVMNADGSNLINLTNSSSHHGSPSWSPDSQQIAFLDNSNDAVRISNSDGSNSRIVAKGFVEPNALTWSSDGQFLMIDTYVGIQMVDVQSGSVKLISDTDMTLPVLSPDAQQIAFTSYAYGFDRAIYIMDIDGNQRRKLAEVYGETFQPVWSLDGQQVAFQSDPLSDLEAFISVDALYVVNSDGSHLYKIKLIPYHWIILFLLSQIPLVAGFYSSTLYVRRHAQQAALLVGLHLFIAGVILGLMRFDGFLLACGLSLLPFLVVMVSISWGLRQVKEGTCWLMQRRGEA